MTIDNGVNAVSLIGPPFRHSSTSPEHPDIPYEIVHPEYTRGRGHGSTPETDYGVPVDDHHLDIIRLAWARELGLGDTALRPAHTVRVVGESIHVLDIAGAAAIIGPRWFLDRTTGDDAGALLQPSRLLEASQGHGGQISGPVDLAFLGDYADTAPEVSLLISHERSDALAVAALCPPDDSTHADLGARGRWFTVVGDDDQALGCSAYSEFQGLLADLTTLISPAHRRQGVGGVVTRLAAEDALDSGLIPQLRTHRGSAIGATFAHRANFDVLGAYARVHLHLPD